MNPTTQSSTTSTHPARQQRILRLPEVKAKTGFGRSTIYAPFYIKRGANGEFPRSIRIGARAVGWREATEGLSPDRAAKALMAAGYLVPDGNRPQRKVSLPDNTRPRMYCVKGSILDD